MKIDINRHDEQISKNFKMYEIFKSDTASRLQINNIPDESLLPNAIALANNVLEPIRAWARTVKPDAIIQPTSWYRCEALEKVICRVAYKNWCSANGLQMNAGSWKTYFGRKSHPTAQAVDFIIPGIPNRDLYNYIQKNLKYDQVIIEGNTAGQINSGWVHVSFNPNGNRASSFEIKNPV